jgi:hypothetical protein
MVSDMEIAVSPGDFAETLNRRIEVTEFQREIKQKKRVIEQVKKSGNIEAACRRCGIVRSTLDLWRDRCR